MKSLLIVLSAIVLSGCDILPRKPDSYVPVPANLLTRCERIPNIKDRANMGDLMTYSVELMKQYNECAVRHDSLVEAVTKKKKD